MVIFRGLLPINGSSPLSSEKRKITMENMNAREFMKTMENLINSPNQKLIGDLNSGFVYADKANPELMYAATEISKANRRTQKIFERSEAFKSAINAKYGVSSMFAIKNVIFNEPATIVFWEDGTKTVVKAENEDFDPEKGLVMAIAKKVYGNKGSYFNQIRKWTETYYEEEEL